MTLLLIASSHAPWTRSVPLRYNISAFFSSLLGHPLRGMGVLKGKNQLEHLMETVSIDYYLDFSKETDDGGRLPISIPEVRAIACSPKNIVDKRERGFQRASESDLKTLDGEPAESEEFLKPSKSLTVYSSSVTGAAGLERIRGWFAATEGLLDRF
jgi:hypothetical protein